MRSGYRLTPVLLVAGFISGIGCASHPLPLSAQAGSTIAIPLDNTLQPPGAMGYGGTWLEDLDIYDDQRGRLTFTFTKDQVSETVDPLVVTRMFPDSASLAAQTSVVIGGGISVGLLGQPVALVTIPDTLPADTYDITVGRKIRIGETPDVWDDTITPVPNYEGQIEVLPANVGGVDGEPNPPQATFPGGATVGIKGAMEHIYPRPTLVLTLPINPRPAAGTIVVAYPTAKASVQHVIEPYRMARDTFLTASPAGNDIAIDFVAPGQSLTQIGIVFELTDPFGAGGGRAATSDFTIDHDASRLYDADGVRIHNETNPTGIDPGTVVVTQIR